MKRPECSLRIIATANVLDHDGVAMGDRPQGVDRDRRVGMHLPIVGGSLEENGVLTAFGRSIDVRVEDDPIAHRDGNSPVDLKARGCWHRFHPHRAGLGPKV